MGRLQLVNALLPQLASTNRTGEGPDPCLLFGGTLGHGSLVLNVGGHIRFVPALRALPPVVRIILVPGLGIAVALGGQLLLRRQHIPAHRAVASLGFPGGGTGRLHRLVSFRGVGRLLRPLPAAALMPVPGLVLLPVCGILVDMGRQHGNILRSQTKAAYFARKNYYALACHRRWYFYGALVLHMRGNILRFLEAP